MLGGDLVVTISLCMIVKNEEDTIGKCLESVIDAVDEIVIIDTGSADSTKQIVSKFTDKIYDFEWIDNFSAARNHSFHYASMDYILWLDADDILLKEDLKKLLDLKNEMDLTIDSVTMKYNLEFDNHENVITSLRRNRLVKRSNNFQWQGAVHEYLEVKGNIIDSDIAVTHRKVQEDPHRNIKIYESLLRKGEHFSDRDLYYYANELQDHQKFQESINYYNLFLNSNKGWIEDKISACENLSECYHKLGDEENELRSIIRSFEYGIPRAESSCRIGYLFFCKNQLEQAVFWYNLATQLEKPKNSWGKVNHACWSWLPHLMLCSCYFQMGNIILAHEHNELALKYLPNNANLLENRYVFQEIMKKEEKIDEWKNMAKRVDESFCEKDGSKALTISFILEHTKLCGGVKSVFEYSNYLGFRKHIVNIISHDVKPDWMEIQSNFIHVPANQNIADYITNTDLIITTCWNQLEACFELGKAPVLHFEQGDNYLFEFEDLPHQVKQQIRNQWLVPVPILTVSSGLASIIETKFKRQSKILPYALNENIFYARSQETKLNDTPHVMFVGPEQWFFKGIADIMNALEIVKHRGYKVEPVWVTQFKPETRLEGTIYVSPSQEKLGELYRTADVYVCGSFYESFSLPPLEAMTCGCPVISTRNIGVLEYGEHDKNCLLTNVRDVEGIAEAIIEVICNEKKRKQLVCEGYKTASKYKVKQVIDNLERYLYGVLENSE